MLLLIFLALLPASLLILWLYSSPFYWKRKGVPSLWPLPIFGNLLPSLTMSFTEFYDKLYHSFPNEKFGGFHILMNPVLLLRDPELIKDVFIKDFEHFSANGYTANYELDPYGRNMVFLHGDEWKEIRGKFSKYFTPHKLRNTVQDYVELSMKKFNNAIQHKVLNKKPIKIDQFMEKLTTDIIIQATLGVETDSFTKNSYFNKLGEKIFSSWTNMKLLLGLAAPQMFIKLKCNIIDNEVIGFLQKILNDVIHERETKNVCKNDLLSDMMKLLEENRLASNNDGARYQPNGNKTPVVEYDIKTIFAQILILILGGMESSAVIMSFLLYELSINQEIQEKCRQEILDVINETGTDIRQEDVRRLTYLEMAINEATRMYPPFLLMPRRCTKRYQFRDSDVVIEPGTILILPIRSIQWDPKYFPEPEKFLPERFSEENKCKMDPGINLSWGLGPRTCLGMNFAKLEMQLVLSRLLSKYRFTLSSRTGNPVKLAKYTVVPKADPAILLNLELLN